MSPSNRRIILPLAIVSLAIAIATALYLSRPEPEKSTVERQLLLVNAAEVVKQDIQISVRAQGIVSAKKSTALIAEVSGRIIDVSEQFLVGGFFKKGEVLLRIDQRNYQSDLKRAEAAVASANSNLASEQGRADVAHQDWLKYKSSVVRSDSATSLALRKPQMEHAKAQLDSALADLDFARNQLNRTIIRAPYDGLIKARQVNIGQYVNVGALCAEIFAIDVAELRLALPENKLSYLSLPTFNDSDKDNHEQSSVELRTDAEGELQRWQAKLVRTEGVFDDRSRVLHVVAEIADPYGVQTPREHILRMGTFVDATIEGRRIENLVALPRHILRAGNQLWVIDQQQRLQNRHVTILRTEGSQIYVSSGLNEGERVCLSTISGAIPGTQVRIASSRPSNLPPVSEQPPAPENANQQDDKPDIAPTAKPADLPVQLQKNQQAKPSATLAKDQAA